MDIKAKAAGKMAALTDGAVSLKKLEAKSKTHQVTPSAKYDTRGALNKLHQVF